MKYNINQITQNHRWAEQFDGGIVMQTFLDFTNYHHYHAPVSGEDLFFFQAIVDLKS